MEHQQWTYSPFRWGRDGVDRSDGAHPVQGAKDLFVHPGPLRHFDSSRERKRVCVVGGGIAGLAAAYELASLDHEVVVLEAARRFGGRIWTHRFGDGTYGEIGAMRLPEEHACVWHYVDQFGLRRREFVSENHQGYLYLRGARCRMAQWHTAIASFDLHDAERARPSDLTRGFREHLQALLGEPALWAGYSNWIPPGMGRKLEELTLGQVARGARPTLHPGFSNEGWEYVGRATGHLWLERTALLHWLREEFALGAAHYELENGMETLVDAFRERIGTARQSVTMSLESRVVGLRVRDDAVQVRWLHPESGTQEQMFDFVICTTPAHATGHIDFYGAMPPRKREALTNLHYLSAGKTLIHCRERHWEHIDGIFGGSSRTDLPIQQCWYPNDNAVRISDTDADHISEEAIPDPVDPRMPHFRRMDWKGRDPEVSRGPGVFLAAYMWGTNAHRFASLSKSERDEMVLRHIAPIHPRNDDLYDELVHWSWDAHTSPVGGAFAWFAPGEQCRYQAALCEPVSDSRGTPRVLFAGEHMGVTQGWIQGAIQTALAAAIHVLRSR